MGWFRASGGRIIYRGRLTRKPLTDWLGSEQGAAAVEAVAAQDCFRIFRAARARRRLRLQIEAAVRTHTLRAAIAAEAERFASILADLSYAPTLPRGHVALHRLVVVPRALVAARVRRGVRQRLWDAAPLTAVDESVRAFFCEQLVIELDLALRTAHPSARNPIHAREEWSCIGTDTRYSWVDSLWSGPGWAGHVLMYEFPCAHLTRTHRAELDRAVRALQKRLASLTRLQREEIVRSAATAVPA
jgi:hypothetical protein